MKLSVTRCARIVVSYLHKVHRRLRDHALVGLSLFNAALCEY